MKTEWAQENREATERLKKFVHALTPPDFDQTVGDGWTVKTLLCHLPLWDGRAYYTLRQWAKSGVVPSNTSADVTDMVNLASRDIFTAIEAHAGAELAIQRAESLDTWLETLDDAFCAKVAAAGFERMLRRGLHRGAHLAQMERTLGR